MKKLLTTNYPDWAFNIATLLIRVVFGSLMLISHGFNKLQHFSEKQHTFADPFHIGHKWSLLLVIFAEVFCSILVIIGLFSRIAVFPLVIAMSVALFSAHKGNFVDGESSALYLVAFSAILLVGPGKASVDGLIGK